MPISSVSFSAKTGTLKFFDNKMLQGYILLSCLYFQLALAKNGSSLDTRFSFIRKMSYISLTFFRKGDTINIYNFIFCKVRTKL